MKTINKTKTLRKNRASQGGTLFVALFITALIGGTLASFLIMVSQQSAISARSMAFNFAVPVMEAGVEEALAHLYEKGITNVLLSGDVIPYLFSNGWQNESGVAVMR